MSPDPEMAAWFTRRREIQSAKESADVGFLRAALTYSDPSNRSLAAEALAELGATDAVPDLTRLLIASNRHLRISAIKALGELGATEAAPSLRELASTDPDPTVRGWACGALADLGDGSALDLTLPLLRDPSITVRGSAAYTLGRLGDPRALDALRTTRPRLRRSPVEWWAYRETYREAISALKRRRDGKAPRTLTQVRRIQRLRTLAWVSGVTAAVVVLWTYAGFWWGVWLVVVVGLVWLTGFILFFRIIPLED